MNFRISLAACLCSLLFVGCDSAGSKETVVGQVNNEPVYQEDLDLIKLMAGPNVKPSELNYSYGLLFSRMAIYSAAVSEHPEYLRSFENRLKILDDNSLAFVFQRFYSTERLGFSDKELRAEFEQNRNVYGDSASYMRMRKTVAERLFMKRNSADFNNFATQFRMTHDVSSESTSVIERAYIDSHRQKVANELPTALMKKYGVVENPIVIPSEEEFFELHKPEYMTSPGFEVYHVESPDSAALESLFKDARVDLETFKSIASSSSTNPFTAPLQGYVGKVLDEHCLPYGIGIVPDLFEVFKDKEPGFISPVIRSKNSPRYHVFYLAKVVPPEQKTLDRVRGQIRNLLYNGINYELDSNYVLISCNGKPEVRERDILELFKEGFSLVRNKQSHDRLVSTIAQNIALAAEARTLKLDKSWEYKALKRSERVDFVIDQFRRNSNEKVSHPKDSLKVLFDSIGNPAHPGAVFENSLADLSDWLDIPDYYLKRMYYYDYQFRVGETYEQARADLFRGILVKYRQGRWDGIQVNAWGKAVVALHKDGIKLLPQVTSAEKAFEESDSVFARSGRLDLVLDAWNSTRDRYCDNEEIFRNSTYKVAQALLDLKDFAHAERELYSYYMTWPEGQDAEAAMFSRAFTLSEDLHRDADALVVLEDFQKKYPNSQFKESAEWLISNIKSNGKVARDLLKKIESADR